jgi:hypothetical protein
VSGGVACGAAIVTDADEAVASPPKPRARTSQWMSAPALPTPTG